MKIAAPELQAVIEAREDLDRAINQLQRRATAAADRRVEQAIVKLIEAVREDEKRRGK